MSDRMPMTPHGRRYYLVRQTIRLTMLLLAVYLLGLYSSWVYSVTS